MAERIRILSNQLFSRARVAIGAAGAFVVIASASGAAADGIGVMPFNVPSLIGPGYNWTGFYLGGHIGGAFGTSNWSTPGASGSSPLYQTINTFDEAGSFVTGIQGGYNYLLPNRVLIGGEADSHSRIFRAPMASRTGPYFNFTSAAEC